MVHFTVVVLGEGGVGKSCVTIQYTQKTFVTKYNPTVEDTYRKTVEVDEFHVVLEILDTAGTDQFTSTRDIYMTSGHGFMLVYSVTSETSINNIETLYKRICKVKDKDVVPCVLLGNKCDLEDERQVQQDEGQKLADQIGAPFFECSAKLNVNIDEAFDALIRYMGRIYPSRRKGEKCIVQ